MHRKGTVPFVIDNILNFQFCCITDDIHSIQNLVNCLMDGWMIDTVLWSFQQYFSHVQPMER